MHHNNIYNLHINLNLLIKLIKKMFIMLDRRFRQPGKERKGYSGLLI